MTDGEGGDGVRWMVIYLCYTICVCCERGGHGVGVGWLVLLWQHVVCSLFCTDICVPLWVLIPKLHEGVKWEHVCADQCAGCRW